MLSAGFITPLVVDGFGQRYGLWGTIAALAMHRIPTGLILITLAVAWRWEWVGAVLFRGLGAA